VPTTYIVENHWSRFQDSGLYFFDLSMRIGQTRSWLSGLGHIEKIFFRLGAIWNAYNTFKTFYECYSVGGHKILDVQWFAKCEWNN